MTVPTSLNELVAEVQAAKLPPPARRRRIRQTAKVSLRDAAAVLGVSPMTLWRWENGEEPSTRQAAIRYRQFLEALEEASR